MEDLDIVREFNIFSKSINLLATTSEDLKNQIDAVVLNLSSKLVEIKDDEFGRINHELDNFNFAINEKKDRLDSFVKETIDEITKYNETIKLQISEIKTISQNISDDSNNKFNKSINLFDDKMKELDEQIQNLYSAGLKSDFDSLTKNYFDLERNYSSLSSVVQGSFIQPISEIKNDLKNLEIKIDNSFNNLNNNINHKFDNVLNKIELLSKDQVATTDKVNIIMQKSDNSDKKINLSIILSFIAFILLAIILVFTISK